MADNTDNRLCPLPDSIYNFTTNMKVAIFLCLIICITLSCQPPEDRDSAEPEDVKQVVGTFGYDLEFLDNHLENLILLKDSSDMAQILLAPQYQGRVMTSTAGGEEGKSFGWINYDLISSGEVREHINPYGGEDRFWMGPEGGQFAIFFDEGDDFVFEDWQTPAPIDSEPFEVASRHDTEVVFTKNMELQNYSGSSFAVGVSRKVSLLTRDAVEAALDISLAGDDLQYVAFSSDNQITNTGDTAWKKNTGLLSIWILGMFVHSPQTTVVIPFNDDPSLQSALVNDTYFGKVPSERLRVEDGFIFFKGDGAYRSKIGVSPERALPIMGSYDAENKVLTIISFSLPAGETDYVNSMWEIQNHPYDGDVINSYNDGPLADGSEQLGPFYELESSSPAAALQPGKSLSHRHTTMHFMGNDDTLDRLSQEILGIGIAGISQIFSE